MGCGFPTVCGVVAWPLGVPDIQRAGKGWKLLVSLAGPSLVFLLCPLMRISGAFRYFWPTSVPTARRQCPSGRRRGRSGTAAASGGPVGATEILAPQSTVCEGVVCNGNPQGACMPYQATLGQYYPAFAPASKIETLATAACAASCVVVK
jgi:hypothetical protein